MPIRLLRLLADNCCHEPAEAEFRATEEHRFRLWYPPAPRAKTVSQLWRPRRYTVVWERSLLVSEAITEWRSMPARASTRPEPRSCGLLIGPRWRMPGRPPSEPTTFRATPPRSHLCIQLSKWD